MWVPNPETGGKKEGLRQTECSLRCLIHRIRFPLGARHSRVVNIQRKMIAMKRFASVVCSVSTAVLFSGCAHSVKITKPSAGTQQAAVTELEIKFHERYAPPFTSTLNGVPLPIPGWGGSWIGVPASGAGAASVMTGGFPPGESTLAVTGDFSPSKSFDVHGDTIKFTPPAIIIRKHIVLPTVVSASTGPASHSGSGSSAGFSIQIPNAVVIGTTQDFDVASANVPIHIQPDNGNISLNGAAPGAPIDLATVGTSVLHIYGNALGAFTLTASAIGCQTNFTSGSVTH